LDQISLLLISWLKNLLVQLDQQSLEDGDVADKTVNFERRQHICDGHKDQRRQSFQVGIDEEDVSRLKEIVTVDEDERIQSVQAEFVDFTPFRPQTRNFQYQDVRSDGQFPVEVFHFHRN
jgi:hypothetical protein